MCSTFDAGFCWNWANNGMKVRNKMEYCKAIRWRRTQIHILTESGNAAMNPLLHMICAYLRLLYGFMRCVWFFAAICIRLSIAYVVLWRHSWQSVRGCLSYDRLAACGCNLCPSDQLRMAHALRVILYACHIWFSVSFITKCLECVRNGLWQQKKPKVPKGSKLSTRIPYF